MSNGLGTLELVVEESAGSLRDLTTPVLPSPVHPTRPTRSLGTLCLSCLFRPAQPRRHPQPLLRRRPAPPRRRPAPPCRRAPAPGAAPPPSSPPSLPQFEKHTGGWGSSRAEDRGGGGGAAAAAAAPGSVNLLNIEASRRFVQAPNLSCRPPPLLHCLLYSTGDPHLDCDFLVLVVSCEPHQTFAPDHKRAPMAGLEELKKKLQPLLFDDPDKDGVSTRIPFPENTCDSYVVSDGGTINLLSRSFGEYNINEHGFHKRGTGPDESDSGEKAYRCASHDMHIFGPIGNGASSVVQRAIFIPVHRILALKKINIFEKEKRQQILNEMRTLCEACCYPGLVEFQGAFYMPDSGQISIALEYMDGGSLADVIKVKKSIPEPVLAHMLQKVLLGLCYLHEVRHLVHRDIKPANMLVNLKGEAKITDFGVSAGLDNTMAMCATFVGTVTYMSPERIRNENYSYAADIWSLGLTILECATGKFPYNVNEGPANLMLQILDDPSPTPPEDAYSPEFCSFINDCLQKDAEARPTCEQLLSHPFIKRYEKAGVDLAAYVKGIVNPTERLKQIAEMLAVHYYLLFNGSDGLWHHMKTFYMEESTFSFSGNVYVGQSDIFGTLSNIRKKLKGDRPREKIVHVVEKLHCRANGETGIAIRVSGSFIVGNQFLICGEGLQAEGMPSLEELSIDIPSKRVGQFREQFIMQPGSSMGCYYISRQDLYIIQA